MSKKMDEKTAKDLLGFGGSFGTYDLGLITREENGLSPEELTNEVRDKETRSLLEERRLQARQEGKKAGRPKGENSEKETRMTFIIDKIQLSKIKQIAYDEGTFIKEILFDALAMYLKKYEKDNGEVIPKGRSKII